MLSRAFNGWGFGALLKQLPFYMALLDISSSVEAIQKTAILGPSRIRWEILETESRPDVPGLYKETRTRSEPCPQLCNKIMK